MVVRIVIGLALTFAAGTLAARRLYWLYRVARAGARRPIRVLPVSLPPLAWLRLSSGY